MKLGGKTLRWMRILSLGGYFREQKIDIVLIDYWLTSSSVVVDWLIDWRHSRITGRSSLQPALHRRRSTALYCFRLVVSPFALLVVEGLMLVLGWRKAASVCWLRRFSWRWRGGSWTRQSSSRWRWHCGCPTCRCQLRQDGLGCQGLYRVKILGPGWFHWLEIRPLAK